MTRGWTARIGCLITALLAVAGPLRCSVDSDGSADNPSAEAGAGAGSPAAGGSGGWGGIISTDGGVQGDAANNLSPDSACAASSLLATQVPVDMYFLLDTSGSMANDGKIAALQVGIFRFLGDPASVGLGATAQRFPLPVNDDPEDERCTAADYASPDLPWKALPYPELRDWALTLKAGGFTPTIPALQGAIDACRARKKEQNGHNCVVVLVTDGKPEGKCEPTDALAQAPLETLAANARAEGISIFAIGFPGLPPLGQSVLESIANAGGTKAPIIIKSGDIGQEFTHALGSIRGASLGCEYHVPTSHTRTVDPDFVKVQYTSGNSPSRDIPRHSTAAECGSSDGWYYDDNKAPQRVRMCPFTCSGIQGDSTARVDIMLGCTSNLR